jgi:hypothetical protein
MSLIEKDLADLHVYWTKQKSDGVTEVPIDRHLRLIETVLAYEQQERILVSAAAKVREVLEGTEEFNRGHAGAMSSRSV